MGTKYLVQGSWLTELPTMEKPDNLFYFEDGHITLTDEQREKFLSDKKKWDNHLASLPKICRCEGLKDGAIVEEGVDYKVTGTPEDQDNYGDYRVAIPLHREQPLIEKVREAQMLAGENTVIENLKRKGLLPSTPAPEYGESAIVESKEAMEAKLTREKLKGVLETPAPGEDVAKAYQTYLKDCDCESPGIIVEHGITFCRWCRKPYAKGGMINYNTKEFAAPGDKGGEEAAGNQERLKTDPCEFIDRAIEMLKDEYKRIDNEFYDFVPGYNGIVSLLGYAKDATRWQQSLPTEGRGEWWDDVHIAYMEIPLNERPDFFKWLKKNYLPPINKSL